MKFLVTGARGQLGLDIMKALNARGLPSLGIGRQDADLTDAASAAEIVAREKPDVVVHCAAYTAVDKAESEREACRTANEDGARNIARAADLAGASLVYVSTDYVFDGRGDAPFDEDAPCAPVNWYGVTKEAGERAARGSCPRTWVVRTSWLFGSGEGNFVKTMLRLGGERPELRVVDDQIGSPTFTADLAEALIDLAAMGAPFGNYHAVNEGYVSRRDFAEEILRGAGLRVPILGITSAEYPTPAKRPLNSRLSPRKMRALGLALPRREDALRRFLAETGRQVPPRPRRPNPGA